jgi:hypothetical protein
MNTSTGNAEAEVAVSGAQTFKVRQSSLPIVSPLLVR